MGFDITSLSIWSDQVDKKIFTKIKGNSSTARDLIQGGSVVRGKGTVYFKKANVSANFQSGYDQGNRNSINGISLAQHSMHIERIKDEANYTLAELEDTIYKGQITGAITPNSEKLALELANFLNEQKTLAVAEQLEIALWQGVKSATQSVGNLNRFNGIITQVSGTASGTFSTVGTGLVQKFQNAYLSIPTKVRDHNDFVFAIGQDKYGEYKVDMVNKNIYQPVDDTTVFGTKAKFWICPGLDGTGKVYGLRRFDNLRLGMAEEGEMDKVDLKFFDDSNFHGWGQDVWFSAGITVLDGSEVYYGQM